MGWVDRACIRHVPPPPGHLPLDIKLSAGTRHDRGNGGLFLCKIFRNSLCLLRFSICLVRSTSVGLAITTDPGEKYTRFDELMHGFFNITEGFLTHLM